jgi:heme/copper-type cytochrome/quinol oxidase subunit 2
MYNNNSISFATTAAGCYAISLDNVPSRSDVHEENNGLMLMAVVGIAVAIVAGLLIYFFLIRKKR